MASPILGRIDKVIRLQLAASSSIILKEMTVVPTGSFSEMLAEKEPCLKVYGHFHQ